MFDKRKDHEQESSGNSGSNGHGMAAQQSAAPASAASGKTAVIGPGIRINGEISGEENLLIEGRVEGQVKLANHQVDIGRSGKVDADVTAKVIKISGTVKGDISGGEKVVISQSGNVQGNIVAPRVTLEDGAIFKGSIDMDPGEVKPAAGKSAASQPSAPSTAKPNGQHAAANGKESGSSLNGA